MRNHHHHPHNNPGQHNNQSGAPRPVSESMPPHEAVAGRAYEMWMQQGRPENCDEAIWLEAEGQLIASQHRA